MKLKIITWNIAFAYGIGSEGTPDYQPKSREAFEKSLREIGEVLKNENPDLVFLQEVDFAASRSHQIQELDFISRCSGILMREQLISWDMPYVPYPGLNPSRQFGKVVSGGGILSRYPITLVQNDLLPKPSENSRLYNFFYLHRYFQIAHVKLPQFDLPLTVINLHLEAFSKDNRELHLIKLEDRLRDYSVDLAGGDFNGEISVSQSVASEGWKPIHPSEPTFSSKDPKETLDGFLVKESRVKVLSTQVLQTGTVSDHLPFVMEIEILN